MGPQYIGLVWLPMENDKELESVGNSGFCVIFIYLVTHKFSHSILHFSWASQTLLSHHYLIYLYFPSSPFQFPFLHFLSYNQTDSIGWVWVSIAPITHHESQAEMSSLPLTHLITSFLTLYRGIIAMMFYVAFSFNF